MSGRIRSIKPEILEDAVTAGLSDTAFRLFVATISLADDYGNFRAEPAFVSGQVYWKATPSTSVDSALAELETGNLVTYYVVRGQRYGHIRTWEKNQKISHQGKPRVPGPESAPESLAKPSGDSPEEFRKVSGNTPASVASDSGDSPESLRPDLRSPIMDLRSPITDPNAHARGGGDGPVVVDLPPSRATDDGVAGMTSSVWLEAISQVSKAPQTRLSLSDTRELLAIIHAHAEGRKGQGLLDWVRALATEFATYAAQAPGYGGFGIRRCATWMNSGKPPLARASPHGPVIQRNPGGKRVYQVDDSLGEEATA